jgi:hypothetical protein
MDIAEHLVARLWQGRPFVGTGFQKRQEIRCVDRKARSLAVGLCGNEVMAAGAQARDQPVSPLRAFLAARELAVHDEALRVMATVRV